jgi:hypothetical protein
MKDTVTRDEMRAHVQQAIEAAVSVVGEEAGANEKKLRQQIAELRAEVEILRKRLDEDATVIDLPPMRMFGGARG